MASKYGQQLYGKDLYSSSITQLAGTVSFVPTLAGRLTESEPLVGSISVPMTLAGRIGAVNPLIGTIAVPATFGGRVTILNTLQGFIGFTTNWDGVIVDLDQFRGNISFTTSLFGRLVELEKLESVMTVPVTIGIPSITELELLTGSLVLDFTIAGVLRDINNLRGSLAVDPLLTGDLKRVRSVLLTGGLPISVILNGSLSNQFSFAGSIGFIVNINDVGMYMGPFWDPTTPPNEAWSPIPPDGEIWTPIPETPNWS